MSDEVGDYLANEPENALFLLSLLEQMRPNPAYHKFIKATHEEPLFKMFSDRYPVMPPITHIIPDVVVWQARCPSCSSCRVPPPKATKEQLAKWAVGNLYRCLEICGRVKPSSVDEFYEAQGKYTTEKWCETYEAEQEEKALKKKAERLAETKAVAEKAIDAIAEAVSERLAGTIEDAVADAVGVAVAE